MTITTRPDASETAVLQTVFTDLVVATIHSVASLARTATISIS
jgi:hypothetical protein